MHPMLVDILQTPAGWMLIGGMLIMFAMPIVIRHYVKKWMREEERKGGG